MSFILITGWTFILFPLSFARLEAFSEISDISSPVAPLVLAKAIWFSKIIIARVNVTVLEDVRPLSMLETVLPLSFVPIAVLPRVNTIAFNLAIFPLAHVVVPVKTLPDTEAMLYTFDPLSIVYLPIPPSINPFAFRFVHDELPYVFASIWKEFKSSTVPLFIFPLSFKNSAISVNQNTKTLSLTILKTAFVQAFFVTFDAKVFLFCELTEVKKV